MRLIDADAFGAALKGYFKNIVSEKNTCLAAVIDLNGDIQKLLEEQSTATEWIPVWESLPETENYIMLSFANFDIPLVGRYEEDEEGGAFYIGDDEKPCVKHDIIVNAWMPLVECYREE